MPQKKNPDAKYGDKLIRLFADLLFTGKSRSLTELADMLGCSKQTVKRCVDNITRAYNVKILEKKKGSSFFTK